MNTDSVYPSGAEQSSCKISGCGNNSPVVTDKKKKTRTANQGEIQ